jgi:hypothetical protein
MRRKRDPFARIELIPTRCKDSHASCRECGYRGRVYLVRQESDGGRVNWLPHVYCSWVCFYAYNRGGKS